MKKILVIISAFLIVFAVWGGYSSNENTDKITRQLEIENKRADSLNFLNSFDGAEIEISDFDTSFVGTKRVKSLAGVELLNSGQENLSDYFVSFEVNYIQEIGIMFLEAELIMDDSTLDHITVIGYPFFNEEIMEPDVSFEYFGEKLLASDLLGNVVD